MGIIHRDLKPGNFIINHSQRKIRLIDWGLAEFYFPNNELSYHTATRNYKGPELLVGLQTYDYSLDIWCLGVTFAGVIMQEFPIFAGNDD